MVSVLTLRRAGLDLSFRSRTVARSIGSSWPGCPFGNEAGERAHVGQPQVVLDPDLADLGLDQLLRRSARRRRAPNTARHASRWWRSSPEPRNRQRARAELERIVDAVRLGDRPPACRVAVCGLGDRGQRVAVAHVVRAQPRDPRGWSGSEPSRAASRPRPARARTRPSPASARRWDEIAVFDRDRDGAGLGQLHRSPAERYELRRAASPCIARISLFAEVLDAVVGALQRDVEQQRQLVGHRQPAAELGVGRPYPGWACRSRCSSWRSCAPRG